MKDMNQDQSRTAVRLLTEVACCTIDIHNEVTDDVQVCEATVRYLTKDTPAQLEEFKKTADAALQDKDGYYSMGQYAGINDDLRKVIRLLENNAKASDNADETEVFNKASRLIADFYDVENRGSAYFLTEQACCLIQSQGKESKDAKLCEQALRLITNNDTVQMQAFKERVDATSHAPDDDYDTEQYDGKTTDVRHAVADIMGFAGELPAEQEDVLKEAAQMIAEFYGLDGESAEAA
jgi:hypothetical protein